MKIKENIFDSISRMNANELAFLYDYIKLLEKRNRNRPRKKHNFSIEQILQMTSSSESSWAESVIQEREDRI